MNTPTPSQRELLLSPYYKVGEVAARYNVHETPLRKWVRSGLLTGIAIGNGPKAHFRIPREALETFDGRQVKFEADENEDG